MGEKFEKLGLTIDMGEEVKSELEMTVLSLQIRGIRETQRGRGRAMVRSKLAANR